MKKSHRKDVIIARIIFAVFCFIVILLIVGTVMLVKNYRANHKTEISQIQTVAEETEHEEETQQPQSEESQVIEQKTIMRTTSSVNLREEPNTDCEVLVVLDAGTQLDLLSKEDDWAMVEYQEWRGYVSLDYLEEVTEETDIDTSGEENQQEPQTP